MLTAQEKRGTGKKLLKFRNIMNRANQEPTIEKGASQIAHVISRQRHGKDYMQQKH